MTAPHPGGSWRRDELGARLAATLDLALAALPHLGPESTGSDERSFFTRTKFVCETSLVTLAAYDVADPGPELAERRAALAEQLVPLARTDEVLGWMRMRPVLAPELGVAHLCLAAMGHRDDDFHRAFEHLLATSSTGPAERVAWKDLEADWHRELGAPLPPLDVTAATRRTAYNQTQDVLFGTRESAYALTHGLIYAAAFGRRLPQLSRPLADLLDDTDSMVARCLDEDDYDLGAEVLLTWPYTRMPWSPTAHFGIRTLIGVEDACGILPSMTLRADRFDELDPGERERYYFHEGYHTAYVMGLLVAAVLRTGQELPRSLESAPPDQIALAARLRALVPARSRTPEWEVRYDDLPPEQQGRLTSFLTDVGLRRATSTSDFNLVRDLLTEAAGGGVAPTAMMRQSAELLTRLARATPVGHTRVSS